MRLQLGLLRPSTDSSILCRALPTRLLPMRLARRVQALCRLGISAEGFLDCCQGRISDLRDAGESNASALQSLEAWGIQGRPSEVLCLEGFYLAHGGHHGHFARREQA